MPRNSELCPVGELFAHEIERGAGREAQRVTAQVDEGLPAGVHRQLELLAIRRQDVSRIAVLREVARHRKLRQELRVDELCGRSAHGARGYTIGWLGTASPPMAGTASERMQGPSCTSSGMNASSVIVARERAASPRAVLPA